MNTSLDNKELAKFDRLADDWWDKDGPLQTLHDINPARLAFIQTYAELARKRVLDLGCGGGILSEALGRLGAEVVGIDAQHSAIEVAELHAKAEGLTVEYQTTLVEEFTAEPFDIITCMELLEHVADPFTVIAACERLLKPGGMLFLSTINRSWQAYLAVVVAAEYLMKLLPKQTHDYSKFIKPAELAHLARRVGFEIVACKGLSYLPLTREARLTDSLKVNYLLVCRKP